MILLTGATGFLGGHLIRRLANRPAVEVRAVARSARGRALPDVENVRWIDADLGHPESLREHLAGVDTFVHLAYPPDWNIAQHLAVARALGQQAKEGGVRRVVLCSTAIVVGRSRTRRVDENTPCVPKTDYERTKLGIESALAAEVRGAYGLVVLRPTAIFGPGGRNLLKLAGELWSGHRVVNYLRSSFHGRRAMNLVCVENVVGALEFVMTRPQRLPHETFIVSDDDDPANNFRDVEAALSRHLGVGEYPVPPVPLPQAALSWVLRLAGRSAVDPDRVYDGARLRGEGFRTAVPLAKALESFASWYRARRETAVR
jgi:nucleoside-diphosphate-sugar epimerase